MGEEKDTKILGVIDEIKSFSVFGNTYQYWMCFVMANYDLIFVLTYEQKPSLHKKDIIEYFSIVDDIKKNYLKYDIKKIEKQFTRRIIVGNGSYDNIKLNKRLLSSDKLIINNNSENVELKLHRKQFNIFKGIIQDGNNFADACSLAGADYMKIAYVVLVVVIFFVIVFMVVL